jgi:hypothetical protein
MNKALPVFLFLLVLFNWSCKKEEVHHPVLVNFFSLDGQDFQFDTIRSYYTDYGILHAFESDAANLWIILSENGAEEYVFGQEVRGTDTLQDNGQAKAYAVLEYQDKVYKSLSGSMDVYEVNEMDEGTFEIQFQEGLSLTNGQLRVDNVLLRPCKMFKDVLLTDENGLPLNNAAGAWQKDEVWTGLEWSFFQDAYGDLETGDALNMRGIYPNPFTDIFQLSLYADKQPDLYFVIVNDNFEVILNYQDVLPLDAGPAVLSLDPENMYGLVPGDTFRMYYIIRSEDGYIKGHGDIMRN